MKKENILILDVFDYSWKVLHDGKVKYITALMNLSKGPDGKYASTELHERMGDFFNLFKKVN